MFGSWSRPMAGACKIWCRAWRRRSLRLLPGLSWAPELSSMPRNAPDLDRELAGADLVLVHEWNDHSLVEAIGQHRAMSGGYRLLFHDTHHRSVSEPEAMAAYNLEYYDGVLAFGEVIRERYLTQGWAERVWTWHEAADTRVFRPYPGQPSEGDVIWVGNWGDEERTAELEQYLIRPIESLKLRARVHGVRYPLPAQVRLAKRESITPDGFRTTRYLRRSPASGPPSTYLAVRTWRPFLESQRFVSSRRSPAAYHLFVRRGTTSRRCSPREMIISWRADGAEMQRFWPQC